VLKKSSPVLGPIFQEPLMRLNLRGEHASALADKLARQRIPFLFTTGYSAEVIPPRFKNVIRWEKPCGARRVAEDVGRLYTLTRDAAEVGFAVSEQTTELHMTLARLPADQPKVTVYKALVRLPNPADAEGRDPGA
jgi:hypothetical protein